MNVYILLDRSGSMSTQWTEAIGSINGYVEKLSKTTNVHFAMFDNISHDVIRECKAKDWTYVSDKEFLPRGGTPLYDSCGKIMAEAEKANSKKTMLVVMTDGFENASKEFTQESIKAKVKSWENKKWEVIFLGANFDAVESVSGSIGVPLNKTLNYGAGNFTRGMDVLAQSTAMYVSNNSAIDFNDAVKTSLK